MRKNLASRAFGWLPLFLVLGSGCSLVYDLSPDQCGSNTDCNHFGPNLSCQSGVCVCLSDACSMPTSTGGTGGKGGSSSGGTGGSTGGSAGGSVTGGDAGMAPETGGTTTAGGRGGTTGGTSGKGGKSATGGSGGSGATSAEAGMGGVPAAPECTTHKDCFTLYPDDSIANPRACVQGQCIELKSPDCPVVLPFGDRNSWNTLQSTDAIILGAFAPFSPGSTTLDTIGRNYDLAATELWQKTGGVFAGGTKRRDLVFVVCNDLYDIQSDLLAPAKHLIEDLQVPGIVAALRAQDQQYLWENEAQDNGTFMMMPLYSDQALIDAQDNGLIWHMLSGADKLSVSYQPLLDMTVSHLRALGSLGASEDVKVAHVKAQDEPFLLDTGAYLEKNLTFNGKSASQNLDANLYDPISVTSSYTAPTDPQMDAIQSILQFAPHIVIGSTYLDFYDYIIPGVEKGWDAQNAGRDRPFYFVGALDANQGEVVQLLDNDDSIPAHQKPLYQRLLGINWPSAVDQTAYNDYQDRWQSVYKAKQPGYENFYDAIYYLMYGVAAARQPLTGAQIANGLLRVTATGSKIPQVEVGPNDDMVTYVSQLSSNTTTKIELMGAMGPPNWDVYGGRNDPGSIWCVNTVGVYAMDQLRFNTDTSMLDGTISCFTFPATP